jgi:hypothetical protein
MFNKPLDALRTNIMSCMTVYPVAAHYWPSTRPTLHGIVRVSWAVTAVLSRELHCPSSERLDSMGGRARFSNRSAAGTRRAARGSPGGMRPGSGHQSPVADQ